MLRTSCPAVSGPEGRKTVAHGVSRASHVRKDPQPQRGDRHGRLPCTDTSRELAWMRTKAYNPSGRECAASRCGAPTDDSPRREPWVPRPQGSPAPAGRQARQAPTLWDRTRRREDAKTRRSHGVGSRREAENAEGQYGRFTLPGSCPANANGVETPSPGLAEERGQPWVCSRRPNQPHRGCGHRRARSEAPCSATASEPNPCSRYLAQRRRGAEGDREWDSLGAAG